MPKYSGRVLAQARLPKGSRAAVKRTPKPESGPLKAQRRRITTTARLAAPIGGERRQAAAASMVGRAKATAYATTKHRAPAEDSPDFKWYKHGNKTASLAYARRNPPPKGTTYAITGKYKNRTLVTARKARAEDDAIDPTTKVPYHMREVIKARRSKAAAKRYRAAARGRR